jgi:glycosyltransferase involved in cell wall biosynthesis
MRIVSVRFCVSSRMLNFVRRAPGEIVVKESRNVGRVRCLLLLHELSQTGAPKIAIEAFQALQDRMETMAIALETGAMADHVRTFAPLHVLPQPRQEDPRAPLVRLRRKLDRRAWQQRFIGWKPDIIYVNSVASLPIARRIPLPNAPVLLHVHELDTIIDHYDRWNPTRLQQWPQRYIAVSDAVCDVLVARYGINPIRIARVPPFFNDAAVAHLLSALPPKFKTPNSPFVVGGAGRIRWTKGCELWLHTAAYLRERLGSDGVRFLWVGGEDDIREAEMRLTARKLGVADILTIVPMTPEPFPHYQQFDAFLMTSWEDAFPIVVLEMMAIGKPVVCVRGSGGPVEQVADTGLVVERFDSGLLGEAILSLVRDGELRRRLGEASRERAMSRFTTSAVVPQIWAEIERTVREATGTP